MPGLLGLPSDGPKLPTRESDHVATKAASLKCLINAVVSMSRRPSEA
jgi:hypothetical protein